MKRSTMPSKAGNGRKTSKPTVAKKSGGGGKKSISQYTRASLDVSKDKSISVRKIENGFVVSESGTIGKGKNSQYYNKEYYSITDPVSINLPKKVSFGGKKK